MCGEQDVEVHTTSFVGLGFFGFHNNLGLDHIIDLDHNHNCDLDHNLDLDQSLDLDHIGLWVSQWSIFMLELGSFLFFVFKECYAAICDPVQTSCVA